MSASTQRHRRTFRRLLALAAVATLATIVVAANGNASQRPSRTLRVALEPHTTFAVVDNAPRSKAGSVSAGDATVVTQRTFDAAGRRLGTTHLHCIATRGGRDPDAASFQCFATFKLREGDITATMAYRGDEAFRAAVTGGTGAFEAASGSISFGETKVRGKTLREAMIHLLS